MSKYKKRKPDLSLPDQQAVMGQLKADSRCSMVSCELDGDWVWVTTNLQHHPDARTALKEMGFRYAKRGHALPSGSTGTWAHSCQHPTPTWKGKHKSNKQ